MSNRIDINVTVNEREYSFQVQPYMSLLELLREELNLIGVKEGCNNGECGACTVIMDGEPIRSCLTLAGEANNSRIITIEGMQDDKITEIIKDAFAVEDAVQCGFCSPGFIMAVRALFERTKNPGKKEIENALGGHLCRCTGYETIFRAVERAAARI
ncbi:MAG: (2Fe-2S)-binding protein [Halanaerobiaceae bacterium]